MDCFNTEIFIPAESMGNLLKELDSPGNFDEYSVHKLVYSLFPKEISARFSFAFINSENRIIIHSDVKPDFSRFSKILSFKVVKVNDSIFTKSKRLYVEINSVKDSNDRYYPVKASEFPEWFLTKMKKKGVSISCSKIWKRYNKVFYKGTNKITAYVTGCEAVFENTDSSVLKNLWIDGIGKQKAFGLGMVSLTY